MRAIVHILIVDDHAGVRTLIRELLAESFEPVPGRAVTFAECGNAERALEAIDVQRPDLVTVDLRMLGMNGLECVRHLRAKLPLACIVVVTQFGNETLRHRARFAGADSMVCKDDLNQLPVVTRNYLKREER